MIVWLASYPRSGNSLFALLLKHYFGVPVHNIYKMNPKSAPVVRAIGMLDRPCSLDEMAGAKERYFVKTHELPSDDYPSVYMVRDGRDVLVSYAHYIRNYLGLHEEFSLRETLQDLIVNPGFFHGWSAHVESWTSRPNQAVLYYEKLLTAPEPWDMISKAFSLSNIDLPAPVTNGPPPDFSLLRDIQPDFFQSGKSGRWREELPGELNRLFLKTHGRMMEKLGYV